MMSVLSEVRAATRSIHQSLDDHPLIVRFMRYGDAEAYRGFLEAFRAFVALEIHASLEYISVSDRSVLNYGEWRLALDEDLLAMQSLNQDIKIPNISLLIPALNSRSEFWGFLYVLEGSVLGGRELATTLDSAWPSEFLLRGSQNRRRWPYFLKRFQELESAGEILPEEVKDGAVRSFEAMIAMFDVFEKSNTEVRPYDHSPSPQ